MNTLNSLMVIVFLQVTIVTLVAAIAISLSMRRAALRHAIGVLALAFVLASPAIALLLPKSPWLAGLLQTAVYVGTKETERPTFVAAFDEMELSQPERESSEVVVEPVASRVDVQTSDIVEPTPIVDPNHFQSRRSESFAATISGWLSTGVAVALWIWAVGILVYGLRFVAQWRQLRLLASSIKREPISKTIVDQASRMVGLKQNPPIGISDLAPMPFVLGCVKPVIVLPRSLIESGAESRLREVLIHEFAHVVRHDPWINAAQHVARVIFWIHPGVHWLNRQIARSREEVCDNFVLARTNSADYAQTLLELAEKVGDARFGLSLLGMFLPHWNLEKRIADLLNPNRIKSTRTSRKFVAIIALMFGAICAVIGGIGISAPYAQEPTVRTTTSFGQDSVANPDSASQDLKKITVRGTCHDQNNEPVKQIRARLFRGGLDIDPPELLADINSSDGSFAFPEIEVIWADVQKFGKSRLLVVVTSEGRATWAMPIRDPKSEMELSVELSSDVETISGYITDDQGLPVKDVVAFLNSGIFHYITDCRSSITDEHGIYAIRDVERLTQPERREDPNFGVLGPSNYPILFTHPDYARTRARYSQIPQVVDVVLYLPAVIEGQVIDQVTRKPLANAVVSAQSVANNFWYQTRSDADGNYRLLVNKDHYNIFTDAPDRVAIAAKNVPAESGQTVKQADIQLVRGGFVVGTVTDAKTGKPINPTPEAPINVGHYGPARPRSGATIASTPVNPDGTYRLRVAPGENYVYVTSGDGSHGRVKVKDGEEVKLDLQIGVPRKADPADLVDPDLVLANRLREQARQELKSESPPAKRNQEPSTPQKPSQSVPPLREEVIPTNRQRQDTPVGKLLDKLEKQNVRDVAFTDDWLRTLKAIVDLGSAAVPELIEELDATNDDMMIRCCAFALRAIGDKRAVPVLIRAVPKGLRPVRSDMGGKATDAELGKWAAQNDMSANTVDGDLYMFGQANREIFSALNVLTEQEMGERELIWVSLDGTQLQQQLKRELFYRIAKRYADWWELHAADFTQEPEYANANLAEIDAKPLIAPAASTHYRTDKDNSGSILESVFNPKAVEVFWDLDTNRVAGLPQKWRDANNVEPLMDEIVDWAAREGFDVMGTEFDAQDGQRYYALRSIGLQAWELNPKRWKMETDDITIKTLQAEGEPIDDLLLHFDEESQSIDPKATAPIFYITREGNPGLLFVGVEVKDDSAKRGTVYEGGDLELMPVHFRKGRRFGYTVFEETK